MGPEDDLSLFSDEALDQFIEETMEVEDGY